MDVDRGLDPGREEDSELLDERRIIPTSDIHEDRLFIALEGGWIVSVAMDERRVNLSELSQLPELPVSDSIEVLLFDPGFT